MKKLKAFTVFFAVALSAVLSAFAAPGDLPVHLALDDVPPEDIVSIGSAAEWDAFAASVTAGTNYAGKIVRLTSDIPNADEVAAGTTAVTTMVATKQFFCGTFDGAGHTLTVALDTTSNRTAPFVSIYGATIANLTVTGTVKSTKNPASGLVGYCNDATNVIVGCTVSVAVTAPYNVGGFVGHGGNASLTIRDCVFSGSLSGFGQYAENSNKYAGGFLGSCGSLDLTVDNCLFKGVFLPSGSGLYHPIACRGTGTGTATVSDTYYLHTAAPTASGNVLMPGADGIPVSAVPVANSFTEPIVAADGLIYYASSDAVDEPGKPFAIDSVQAWNAFAASVNSGANTWAGYVVTLATDIGPVTTAVGTAEHPFCGIFDGAGHTLDVALSDDSVECLASFRVVDGATIRDLTVAGSVSAPNYAGGIVGEARGSLLMEGCVFSGTIADFTMQAGGLVGWCGDGLALNMLDCLFKGAFVPADSGTFHPVACRNPLSAPSASSARTYYLNTAASTASDVYQVPGADGIPVSAAFVADEWTRAVTAADGIVYYRAYHEGLSDDDLLVHFTFDDAGNGGLNLLHAVVGADAIVRASPTNLVEGIGEIAAVTDPDILAGLPAGDGAVSIPKGQHLAIPIPSALADVPGRTFTVEMKVRLPADDDTRSLLSMPDSNDRDTMLFISSSSRMKCRQWDDSNFASKSAVATERWVTIAAFFDASSTVVTLDGVPVIHLFGTLAGSRADCSTAGRYFLVGSDDNGDDGLIHLSDIRIYDGAENEFSRPAELFVDETYGNDANDGLSRETALRTIQAAIDIALPGDTIRVAAGIYSGIDASSCPLTIIGAGASQTVIDGYCYTCASLADGATLRGFTLRNGTQGVIGGTLEDCIVENCIYEKGASIPLWGCNTLRCIVRNSLTHENYPPVIGGTHRNTIFSGLSGMGAIIRDATLFNCTVVGCAAEIGIPEYGARRISGTLLVGVESHNCIFWGNSCHSYVFLDIEEPDLWDLMWVSCPEDDANDPKFIAPGIGDYHLCADSPAIDSGDPAYADAAGDVDLDGKPRVQNGRIDRGCYEGGVNVAVRATVIGCGSVSPESVWAMAPVTATFTANAEGWNRPIVGWFTNGVLAASGGDTFTLAGVMEDIDVTVRFTGVDWYVDSANGDDANDGMSSATAFRTSQKAFAVAARDDTIHLVAGTHPPVDDGGRRVFVVGADAGETVIDGGGSNRCATLSGGTTLRGVTLRNGKENDWSGCSGVMGGRLEDCVIEGCSGEGCGVLFNVDTFRCVVHSCLAFMGEVVVGGTHRNALFHGLNGSCVFSGATLYNCTVVENSSVRTDIRNGGDVRNCIFWGNTSGNDAEDPLFANPDIGDYRIRANSPAIDAGDDAYAAEAGETDLAGNARVQGAAIDRGCYEGGVEGLVRFTAAVDGFGGTVSPTYLITNSPATVTFTAEPFQRIVRPVDGWFTNGVLAALGGDTFTLADWSDDVAVTARFAPTNLYVDAASGDDVNDGLTAATQFRTLQAAVNASENRDTIHVATGTYAPVNASGRDVTIIGAGADATTIDAAGAGRCATLSGGTTLRGFTLRNGKDDDRNGCGCVMGGKLEDCVLEDCYGLWCGATRDTDTQRCIVRNIQTGYEAVVRGAHRNTLFYGISAWHSVFAYNTMLFNCTVADCEAIERFESGLAARNCIFWRNTCGNMVISDAEDPMFVSAADGDYRLRAASPAIDAGDAAYAAEAGETDLSGNARVQNEVIDRGCYESPRVNGLIVLAKVEGRGFVSPDSAVVTNHAESVMFTADTSTWGLPVAGWYTNGVMAAGAQNQFLLENICEDTVVTVKFQPGNACIYVDAFSGRNSNDGASPARALRTIQRAIDVSISNDTIRVAAGSYGPIDVGGRALTIIGDGAETTAIDGGGQNRCAMLAEGATLRGFTLRNGNVSELLIYTYPWDGTDASVENGTLEDCIVEDCVGEGAASILFGTSTSRCVIRNCHAKAFLVLYGTHRSSLFYGNRSEELEILDYAESYNCTFADNSTEFPL